MRPTRLSALKYYIAAGILWIIAGVALLFPTGPIANWEIPLLGWRLKSLGAALLGIIGLAAVLVAEFKRLPFKYTLTDLRIIKREGIIRRKEDSVPLYKVERITLKQGVIQRILNYGSIEVDTGEIDEERLVLLSTPKVKLVHQELSGLVLALRSPTVPGYAPPYGPVPQQPAAVTPPSTAYGSPLRPPVSPTMAGPPPRPISSPLGQPPENPPALSGWEAADAEVQNLERQVREDRDFLLKLDASLLDGKIDNATYSEQKRLRTGQIANLERRITERRDEKKPHR